MDLFKEFNQPWKFDSNEERKREELVLVDSLRGGGKRVLAGKKEIGGYVWCWIRAIG